MEKVFIQNCINTGRHSKENKPIFTVELQDGRKCTSWGDDFTGDILQEIEVDIKEGKEYQGVKQYYISKPKAKGAFQSKFPAKDWTFEKRRTALECAVSHCAKKPELTTQNVVEVAVKFYEYLNQ